MEQLLEGLSLSGAAVTLVLTLQLLVANVQSDVRQEGFFKTLFKTVALLPPFFIIMGGMAFHNAIGVIEGFMGKKTSFVRTPKTGTTPNKNTQYGLNQIPKMSFIEAALGIVFGASAVWGFTHQVIQFQVFHAMVSLGYLTVSGYAIFPVLNNMFQQYRQKSWATQEQEEPIYEVSSYPINN